MNKKALTAAVATVIAVALAAAIILVATNKQPEPSASLPVKPLPSDFYMPTAANEFTPVADPAADADLPKSADGFIMDESGYYVIGNILADATDMDAGLTAYYGNAFPGATYQVADLQLSNSGYTDKAVLVKTADACYLHLLAVSGDGCYTCVFNAPVPNDTPMLYLLKTQQGEGGYRDLLLDCGSDDRYDRLLSFDDDLLQYTETLYPKLAP